MLIRLAADDDDFILSLAPRFAGFPLPAWRRRHACVAGIRERLHRQLDEHAANSHLFVAEDDAGVRAGFIHLQRTDDPFTGRANAHIADLAVAATHEGRGVARALLAHAERWARDHQCQLLTLAVFPGNERALKLYAAAGYGTDLLRLAKPLR
jgi:ribosomal protein S18 acetylase RimI-like enzyme